MWSAHAAVNLPALRTTVRAMVEALRKVDGQSAYDLLDWKIDAPIAKIVATWPGNVKASRAAATLGLEPDADLETVVREYVRENPDAVKQPANP